MPTEPRRTDDEGFQVNVVRLRRKYAFERGRS
jgi:hypothetical protein